MTFASGWGKSYLSGRTGDGDHGQRGRGAFLCTVERLLAEPAPRMARRVPGMDDSAFVRGQVPMTKQEVRAAALARLAVRPGEVCWDVGAGTGSVAVELALSTEGSAVFAVECDEEACALIEENRRQFGVWNLRLVCGRARRRWQICPRRMWCSLAAPRAK